jgi:Holliday junction resolvase
VEKEKSQNGEERSQAQIDGDDAEKMFEIYLDERNIPFVRFDQNLETISLALKKLNAKRPDYIMYTKYGNVSIDVKYRDIDEKTKRFKICKDEAEKLYQYQIAFHNEVWLAFNNDTDKEQFFFTNISTIHYYLQTRIKEFEKHSLPYSSKYVFIPDSLILFNQLSFDYGFYQIPDKDDIIEDTNFIERLLNKQQQKTV